MKKSLLQISLLAALALAPIAQAADISLLNVSYDVTREFYKDYNQAFAKYWKQKSGENIIINQSHGGSSKQARAVADGLEADVVTFNTSTDIEFLSENGLEINWKQMSVELLYWIGSGWEVGSTLNLNPNAKSLIVLRATRIAGSCSESFKIFLLSAAKLGTKPSEKSLEVLNLVADLSETSCIPKPAFLKLSIILSLNKLSLL